MRNYTASVTFEDPTLLKANDRFEVSADDMDGAYAQVNLALAHKIGEDPYRVTYICIDEIEEKVVYA